VKSQDNQEVDADQWSECSDSDLSVSDLTPEDKQERTSTTRQMAANLLKLYIGIVFISVSGCIAQVGIYCSIFGIVYVTAINVYCVYILLKARNRFKHRKIVDICDLAAILYGEGARKWMQIVLVMSNSMFLIFYEIFFGT
jgi:hypothetical protein